MSKDEKISQIRKQLPLVKETLMETITREREYEKLYKESMRERAIVQSYYNTLEIQLADLEDRIQRAKVVTMPKARRTTDRPLSMEKEQEIMERILSSLTPDQLQAVLEKLGQK